MNQKHFLILLVLCCFFLFALFFFFFNQQPTTDDDFVFNNTTGLWLYQWTDEVGTSQELFFQHRPSELTYVTVVGTKPLSWQNNTVHVAFNPYQENLSAIQLVTTVLFSYESLFDFTLLISCTREHPSCETRPIISCDADEPVILLQQQTPATLTFNKNCLTISGEGNEILQATERFIQDELNITLLN